MVGNHRKALEYIHRKGGKNRSVANSLILSALILGFILCSLKTCAGLSKILSCGKGLPALQEGTQEVSHQIAGISHG